MSEAAAPYKKTTIVFPITEDKVLLGMKKAGFGEGWWNGFGGKVEIGEGYEQSAVRETLEEANIYVRSLAHVANLHFYFDDALGVVGRAYICNDFDGEPRATDEMKPAFFEKEKLPYDTMWPADKLWVPVVLNGTDSLHGFVVHFDSNKNFKTIETVNPALLEEKF